MRTPSQTTTLIAALRKAADLVLDPKFDYAWMWPERCNCGALACAALNLQPEELLGQIRAGRQFGTWSDSKNFCSSTGLPIKTVMLTLYEMFGFTYGDFDSLEMKPARRAADVAEYMRKWAYELQEGLSDTTTQ